MRKTRVQNWKCYHDLPKYILFEEGQFLPLKLIALKRDKFDLKQNVKKTLTFYNDSAVLCDAYVIFYVCDKEPFSGTKVKYISC